MIKTVREKLLPGLALYLLGPPRFKLDGAAFELKRRKVLALFVYLAVTAQPHSREVLTALLYPEQDRSRARSDFRQTLSILNGTIGEGWLSIDRKTISLPARSGLWIDVHEFRRLIEESRKPDREGTKSEIGKLLVEATHLYRSEFLSGFYLKDSPDFDEWQFFEQESLQQEYILILERLVEIYGARGEFKPAIYYGRIWLSIDPLDEAVHRLLMRLYSLAGQRAAALRQYKKCTSVLEKEFGVAPDQDTEKLHKEIQSGQLVAGGLRPDFPQQECERPTTLPRRSVPRSTSRSSSQDRPTGVMVFLFADMKGRTRFVGSNRREMEVAFCRHKTLLGSVIEAQGGLIFSSREDALHAVFPTASTAASAALRAQISFQNEPWGYFSAAAPPKSTPGQISPGAIGLRIALHAGEAAFGKEGYFGTVVDHTALLLSAAHGGQILLSTAAAELVKDALPEEASLCSLGYHRLKDLGLPQPIFQLLHPNLVSDFPGLKTLDSYQNNLPSQPTSLIGRNRELAEVLDVLILEEVQILTLTGPPGTGKTRLGIHAAAELIDHFEHGVFFVDLAALSEPEQVIPAIAGTLDVKQSMSQGRPLFEILKDYLKSRQVLLLLDNFEHLLPAAGQVAGLLATCPGLKVIVTSRESFHMRGEREFLVPPLSLPKPGISQAVERLTRYEAVRLFIERGVAARPDFVVTKENAPAVAEICVRLDGLPLAIELAASRLRVLSAQDLMKKLADRLKLLKGGSRDLPVRQQTLRGEIDWSYELVDEDERRLFARLSVFVGGCNLEAAEQVCSDPGRASELDVLDGLASLVDKNLLRQNQVAGEARFRMLETIKEYSQMRLEESPDMEAVRQRHACYFLELAEEAGRKLHGPDQMAWLDRLERENGNLKGAMVWFLNSGYAEEGLRLGGALEWFWYRNGHFSDGQKWLEQALELTDEAEPAKIRAKVLDALGWMVFLQGDWSRARAIYRESLELFQKLGDTRGEGMALSRLGVTERWLGDFSGGTEHCEEAVRIAREVGNPLRLAYTLIWAYATTGGKFEGEAPQAELEEAVELSRQLGDLWGISHALNGLGDLFRELGESREARPRYEEALRGFRELKDRWMTAWTLEGLGGVGFLDGDYRNAQGYIKESIALFDLLRDQGNVVFMLSRLGMVAGFLGNHPRAACLLGAFKNIYEVLITHEAASLMHYDPELVNAFSEYQTDFTAEWAQGQVMTYEQAVEYALEDSDNSL